MHTKGVVQRTLKVDTSEMENHLTVVFQGFHRSSGHWWYHSEVLRGCSWICHTAKQQRSGFNQCLWISVILTGLRVFL